MNISILPRDKQSVLRRIHECPYPTVATVVGGPVSQPRCALLCRARTARYKGSYKEDLTDLASLCTVAIRYLGSQSSFHFLA
jgi:hypothetical protein